MAKYKLGKLFEGNFPVTQTYDANPQNYPMFTDPGHEGVDYGTPNGTPVLAPFDGIILRDTFNDKDYGTFTVIWDDKQHCAVWYCHLQNITTALNQRVTKGQVVGHSNNTGHSTGPHLHINFVETDPNGNRLNTNNGKQGFLNILDSNLVQLNLGVGSEGSAPSPAPMDKEQLIIDAYRALTGDYPNADEKKARLAQNLNTVDLLTSLTGDHRFRDKFVQPELQKKDDRIGQLDAEKSTAIRERDEAIQANKQQTALIEDLRKQLATPVTPPMSQADIHYLQEFISWLKSFWKS